MKEKEIIELQDAFIQDLINELGNISKKETLANIQSIINSL